MDYEGLKKTVLPAVHALCLGERAGAGGAECGPLSRRAGGLGVPLARGGWHAPFSLLTTPACAPPPQAPPRRRCA